MVRVLGTSGDSEFHRESLSEDVKIKTKPGMEASEAEGSLQTREVKGFLDHQGFGRGPDEAKLKEEDRSHDLEDKPRPLFEVPSGIIADYATKYEPPGVNPSAKNRRNYTSLPKQRRRQRL